MPAHNEADDVGRVIREIRACCDYPVVVVDDASTDETAAVARDAGAIVIPLVYQLGAWGAIQAGMRYARGRGCKYVLTMDADGQHEAAMLPRLVAALDDVREGSIVELRGFLIEAQADDGWRWRSSLTRDDTGARACELLFVERARVDDS